MLNKFFKKVALLDYLRENKIRKDWLAGELTIKLDIPISPASLSHWLHGRRGINCLYIETAISEVLDVPRNELF